MAENGLREGQRGGEVGQGMVERGILKGWMVARRFHMLVTL